MMAESLSMRRYARLIFVPVVLALIGVWALLFNLSLSERRATLDRVQSQLGFTVATLADFDALAQLSHDGRNDDSDATNASRTAAIWRALLQYPSASIWVEDHGVLSAGQPPQGDRAGMIVVEERRGDWAVHAALARKDALADWQRGVWQRGIISALISLAFLTVTGYLSGALRARSDAERDRAAEQERGLQLAQYRLQLEETVARRTAELQQSNTLLEKELHDRTAAEAALREHDALLNVVTKSAAELLGSQHEDAIMPVLELIGQTVAVSRVQLCSFNTDATGHTRSRVRYEWCAPGIEPVIDNRILQEIDLTVHLPRATQPIAGGSPTTFFLDDISGTYRGLFAAVKMRSFLQLMVTVNNQLWGSLNFIDSSDTRREWSWAETDTLKTLAGLMGAAIGRALQIKLLADANTIVQNSPTILYRLRGEPSFPLSYISHNITKYGHDPQALLESNKWIDMLVAPEDAPAVAAAMSSILKKDATGASIEFRLRTGQGGWRWVENRYTPVRDADGRLIEVEGIIIDITERKAAEEKLTLLARTDTLTGLANRATFVERLQLAYAATRRGARPFAVFYIDVDHFKPVNDNFGHAVGDLLLCEVARRLRGQVRETDLVARLGGDEFALLQLEMTDPASAGTLAEKLRAALAKPYFVGGHDVQVSASIGICPYAHGIADAETMMSQADLALYRSKDEGRNQYHFHSAELDREVQERMQLGEELKQALDHNQLILHYQPQVEVVSGRIVGMEALLRWNHPRRGLLLPKEFLAVAERSGIMMRLGRWVLNQACRQMKLWGDAGIAPPQIAINLSLAQLTSSPELIEDVRNITSQWGLSPSVLEFDVTEAALGQATLASNDALGRLREVGARVAIDDFGTEYSSFTYPRAYGVSHLKIARDYITRAVDRPDVAATVRAIIHLARELGIGVIAEGVETEQQRNLLVTTGATTKAQGHFFSVAVDAQHAGYMLRAGTVLPASNAGDEAATATAMVSVIGS
jgi:diguanylate cyclase (GGDEF)-like protein/PAS domain S-box-containing protein